MSFPDIDVRIFLINSISENFIRFVKKWEMTVVGHETFEQLDQLFPKFLSGNRKRSIPIIFIMNYGTIKSIV